MYADELARVAAALDAAVTALADMIGPELHVDRKAGGDPVTAADHAINAALHACLPRDGEAWLSEESADDDRRLRADRVWIVDPLDGTREFVTGLPEWCISVGLVENGQPIVGGIRNPATGETIIGAIGAGVTCNGQQVQPRGLTDLAAAEILASRSEFERGEWGRFTAQGLRVRPLGSVAYKLALVAAGLTDVTWTLVPKSEWDVAAGVALVKASGADVWIPTGEPLAFNRAKPLLPGLAAAAPGLAASVRQLISS
jgi:myo-inositol-1(or 4)-monophosphatase